MSRLLDHGWLWKLDFLFNLLLYSMFSNWFLIYLSLKPFFFPMVHPPTLSSPTEPTSRHCTSLWLKDPPRNFECCHLTQLAIRWINSFREEFSRQCSTDSELVERIVCVQAIQNFKGPVHASFKQPSLTASEKLKPVDRLQSWSKRKHKSIWKLWIASYRCNNSEFAVLSDGGKP